MSNKLVCPNCQSENITVQVEQGDITTKETKRGCLSVILRWTLILFTFGLWILVPKKKSKSKTKVKNKTVAICQNCGHKWEVKE